MATATLSAQDKRDLDKFTKFLALKSTQIIVQSRLGEKLQTKCKPPQASGIDWFNLAIYDLPEVSTEAKKALIGEMAIAKRPLCVEISLRTVDGYQMILETWTLGILTDHSDPSVKVTCTVYNRMCMLLKTLISVTRVTPAYKLSRQQSSDSYVIFYRIYSGEPQITCLGEKFREVRVGQLDTPGGIIYMTVAFRTEMRINSSSKDTTPITVKSDHFPCEESIKSPEKKEREVNLDEPLKRGAFVDSSKVKEFTRADFAMPEEPAFLRFFDEQRKTQEKEDDVVNLNQKQDEKKQEDSSHPEGIPIKQPYWSKLMQYDEVPMKDMHFPFASSSGSPMSELAQFYKDVSTAPTLSTFSSDDSSGASRDTISTTSPEDLEVSDVTEQLALFETSLQEYDNMVSSLCGTEASSTVH